MTSLFPPPSRTARMGLADATVLSRSAALGLVFCLPSDLILATAAEAATFSPVATWASSEVKVQETLVGVPYFDDRIEMDPNGALDRDMRAAVLVDSVNDPAVSFAGLRFPTSPNTSLQMFASAEARGDGSYGVGASGISFSANQWSARSRFEHHFHNSGATTGAMEYTFHIPQLEASLFGFRGLEAFAHARGYYTIQDEDGRVVSDVTAFDFILHQYTDPATPLFPYRIFQSPGIDRVASALQIDPFYQLGTDGISIFRMPEFSVILEGPDVAPGHLVSFGIEGLAIINFDPFGAEQGAQALVGDPFRLSSGGGPLLRWSLDGEDSGQDSPDPTPAPIPLPAAAWLMLGALAALGGVRCRRR